MSNQFENLKNSIKREYVKFYELNLMNSSGFIPVDKRQSEFFAIVNKSKLNNKGEIEELIQKNFPNLNIRLIPIDDSDFNNLIKMETEQKLGNES